MAQPKFTLYKYISSQTVLGVTARLLSTRTEKSGPEFERDGRVSRLPLILWESFAIDFWLWSRVFSVRRLLEETLLARSKL